MHRQRQWPHSSSSVKRIGDIIENTHGPKKACTSVVATSTRGGGAPFVLSNKPPNTNFQRVLPLTSSDKIKHHSVASRLINAGRSNSTQLYEEKEIGDNSVSDLSGVVDDSISDPNYGKY